MRKTRGAAVIGALVLLLACGCCAAFIIRSDLFSGVWQKLLAGGLTAAVFVFGFMLSSGASKRSEGLIWLAALCAVAVCVRLAFIDRISWDYRTFLSKWMQYFRENNGFRGIAGSVGDYNVTYLYFLALFSYSPLSDLFLIKLLSIAFDFVAAFYAMKIAGAMKSSAAYRSAAFFSVLFLPTVVTNGAYWGQCDSIYAAFALGALYFAIEDRVPTSLAMLGIAVSFKLQTVFIMPFWALLLLTGRLKFRWLPVFPAAYAVTILPAVLLGKPLGEILNVYVDQLETYSDYLNLNAPSVFGFFGSADVDTASTFGIIAAALFCAALLVPAAARRSAMSKKTLCLYALAFCIGVPFLLPHMHERYYFMAEALSIALVWVDFKLLPAALLTQAATFMCYRNYLKGAGYDLRIPSVLMGASLILTVAALYLSKRKGRKKA
mgnify:FL=1|jgi:Gpi18-like mannosyltransferase